MKGDKSTNKRKLKEEAKIEANIKNDSDNKNKFAVKYSNTTDVGLVPKKYKSLFTNMKDSEEDYTPPKGIMHDSYRDDVDYRPESRDRSHSNIEVREFMLKDTPDNKELSYTKGLDEIRPQKSNYFPEESDPKAYYSQYLQVNNSPNKKANYTEVERENSVNSNLSHSFAYNHEDFTPFSSKVQMNLSKPTEINFDNLNMLPNTSNFAYNMLNRLTEGSRSGNKQINLTLNYSSHAPSSQAEGEGSVLYDLNAVSGAINLQLNKGKKITLEVTDLGQLQVRVSPKEGPINVVSSSEVSYPLNISQNGNTPTFSTHNFQGASSEMMAQNKFNVYVSRLQSNSSRASKNELRAEDLSPTKVPDKNTTTPRDENLGFAKSGELTAEALKEQNLKA